ncbi:MAG: D-glycero-beta-D-manno-heptose 1-phosphate adenylyltransferase [Mucilaginibacter sp.]|nr:D-glycero-beta-D-manno-heptose 1-phosphate adenylyltransferase [Mucilaginibacter sp.]
METAFDELLHGKLYDAAAMKLQVDEWRAAGQKIVFTNGIFDLVHIGHITYLSKAAKLGHKLIIGLNSDDSVKRLKGGNRPINDQKSRASLLAALFFVSGVVIFDELTPQKLIASLLPDVLVKGSDYAINFIVGAEDVIINGGSVQTIDFVDGYSSTRIIEKIRNQVSEA